MDASMRSNYPQDPVFAKFENTINNMILDEDREALKVSVEMAPELRWKMTMLKLIELEVFDSIGGRGKDLEVVALYEKCLTTMKAHGFKMDDNLQHSIFKPIYAAAFRGCALLTRALVHCGTEVDIISTDEAGQNALHIAAERGQAVVVQELISLGAEVNFIAKEHGATPLIAGACHSKVVRVLCKNGADVDAIGSDEINGPRALHKAVKGGKRESVQILLKHGAHMSESDYQNLCKSAMQELAKSAQYPDKTQENGGSLSAPPIVESRLEPLAEKIVRYINVLFVLHRHQTHSYFTEKMEFTRRKDARIFDPITGHWLCKKIVAIRNIAEAVEDKPYWYEKTQMIKLELNEFLNVLQGYKKPPEAPMELS